MEREARKYLLDARTAAGVILDVLKGQMYQDYLGSIVLRSAVERQFQILGEAIYQVQKQFPSILPAIPGHREIIRFRHMLVHHYDKIENEVVWGIAKVHLDPFIKTIDSLLL